MVAATEHPNGELRDCAKKVRQSFRVMLGLSSLALDFDKSLNISKTVSGRVSRNSRVSEKVSGTFCVFSKKKKKSK